MSHIGFGCRGTGTRLILTALLLGFCFGALDAQTDLDAEDRKGAATAGETRAQGLGGFSGTTLLHLPSTEMLPAGTLELLFYHRFGNGRQFAKDLGGLDNGARVTIAADYAFTDWFIGGLARSGNDKTWELRGRALLLDQGDWPIAMGLAGAIGYQQQEQTVQIGNRYDPARLPQPGPPALNAAIVRENTIEYELSDRDRTSFAVLLPLSRQLNPTFAIELVPLFVHRNFVPVRLRNDRWGLGTAIAVRLSGRISIVAEALFSSERDYVGSDYRTEDRRSYGNITQLTAQEINVALGQNPGNLPGIVVRNIVLDRPVDHRYVPVSIGVDIDTGGHVFQVFVTNTRNMTYTRLLRGADFDYRRRDFALAFNISRRFWLGGE